MSFPHPDGMEIGLVKPGHWRIEGYDVKRIKERGRVRWDITHFERFVAEAPTLEEACYRIDEDQHERRNNGD